jgi:hypothetical protein
MAARGEMEQEMGAAPLLADADRFRLLGRLLENDDVEFLANCPPAALRLRRGRARIFRGELGVIRVDLNSAFRSRLHRIGECGQWSRIFGLIGDTALAYTALSRLQVNGILYRYSIPAAFHTFPNTDRLCRYLTFEMVTAVDPA